MYPSFVLNNCYQTDRQMPCDHNSSHQLCCYEQGWHFPGKNLFFPLSGKNQVKTGKNWYLPVKTTPVLKTVVTCLLHVRSIVSHNTGHDRHIKLNVKIVSQHHLSYFITILIYFLWAKRIFHIACILSVSLSNGCSMRGLLPQTVIGLPPPLLLCSDTSFHAVY